MLLPFVQISTRAVAWLDDEAPRGGDGTPNHHNYLPLAYMILGDGEAVLRVIVEPESPCPLLVGNEAPPMVVRATGDHQTTHAFPITVCEARLAQGAMQQAWNEGRIHIDGVASSIQIPLRPQRTVLLGDTGLRSKPNNPTTCATNATLDAAAPCRGNATSGRFQSLLNWSLSTIADYASVEQPDLVLHMGDYVYRQGPCLEDHCAAMNQPHDDLAGLGNWGDTWYGWWADFVYPSLSLLQTAPWIVGRGNHESCHRAGHGYFLLLDPRPYPLTRAGDSCADHTSPYAVSFEEEQFIVVDNAVVGEYFGQEATAEACPSSSEDGQPIVAFNNNRYNDPQANLAAIDADIERLQGYWQHVERLTQTHATNYVVVHRPVLGFFCNADTKHVVTGAEWNAPYALLPSTLDRVAAILSGHRHMAQVLEFDSLPTQLVVGHGGTELDTNELDDAVLARVEIVAGRDNAIRGRVQRGFTDASVNGFALLERLDKRHGQVNFYGLNASTGDLFRVGYPVDLVPRGQRALAGHLRGYENEAIASMSI